MHSTIVIVSPFLSHAHIIYIEPEPMDKYIDNINVTKSDKGTPQVSMEIKVRLSISQQSIVVDPHYHFVMCTKA